MQVCGWGKSEGPSAESDIWSARLSAYICTTSSLEMRSPPKTRASSNLAVLSKGLSGAGCAHSQGAGCEVHGWTGGLNVLAARPMHQWFSMIDCVASASHSVSVRWVRSDLITVMRGNDVHDEIYSIGLAMHAGRACVGPSSNNALNSSYARTHNRRHNHARTGATHGHTLISRLVDLIQEKGGSR